MRPTPTDRPVTHSAQVVDVVDGDTIKVRLDGQTYTVRYIGIDTPETVHPSKPVQWMGPEASDANRRLVAGRTVRLEKDVSETDRYGRLLRYVWVGDTMVNAELVRQGYAQVSTYPPDVKYQKLFLELQADARAAGRGLWGQAPAEASADASAPTVTPRQPSPTQAPAQPREAPCLCDSDRYNCDHFSFQASAQACYQHCRSLGHGDVHGLDGNDDDGRVCENMP